MISANQGAEKFSHLGSFLYAIIIFLCATSFSFGANFAIGTNINNMRALEFTSIWSWKHLNFGLEPILSFQFKKITSREGNCWKGWILDSSIYFFQ
jgi:hypothetical protein